MDTKKSGGITLQSIRPSEGEIVQYYDKHTSAVSVLKLSADERRAISGSWDKNVVEWDLDTGKPVRSFDGCSGQISSIEWQPVGGTLVQQNAQKESPLFGGGGGGGDGGTGSNGGGAAADDDDEKSLGSLFGDDDDDDEDGGKESSTNNNGGDSTAAADGDKDDDLFGGDDGAAPAAEATDAATTNQVSHSVFLTNCIDGTVDIWDRRSSTRVAHAGVTTGTPPWSMSVSFQSSYNTFSTNTLFFFRLVGATTATAYSWGAATARWRSWRSSRRWRCRARSSSRACRAPCRPSRRCPAGATF